MSTEFRQFKHNRNCPAIRLEGPIPGFYYVKKNNFIISVECDCHKKWAKENKVYFDSVTAHVDTNYDWSSYRGKLSLDSLNKMKKLAKNPEVVKKQRMIYLHGKNGTQKTSMAKVLGKKYIEQGYSVYMLTMRDLMVEIRDDFNLHDEELISKRRVLVDKLLNVDFLFIDEAFDRDKYNIAKSGYDISFLDNFLRTRFERNHKSIIFISNVKPSEINAQGFGQSIENLIERNVTNTVLEFEDDYNKSEINVDNLWEEMPNE